MRREYGIPIVLWACAAAWVHMMVGGGGFAVAMLHDDQRFLLGFGKQVRERVKSSEQAIAVEWDGTEAPEETDAREAPAAKEQASLAVQKKPDEKKPASDKAKEEEKKKAVALVQTDEKPKTPPPEMFDDKRIAVKQHAKPNQDDNPNAKFLSEEANHVEKETHATQTNREEDHEVPTQGGTHAGAAGAVGNAEKTKVREAEEHAGSKETMPGERGKEQDPQKNPTARAMGPQKVEGPTSPTPPKSGGDGKQAAAAAKAPEATQALKTQAESPEVVNGTSGGWSFNPVRQGVQAPGAASSNLGKTGDASKGGTTQTAWLGLGGQPGPGQVNLNLSHDGVVASVGVDQLRKERQSDGERRLSEHRGSWQSSNFERWKSSIENYVASVQPGNQTSLNAARSPFATYIHAMHLRIHRFFADSFLDSLESLPATHPLSNPKIFTRLEIVLNKEGQVAKLGVVKPSGITAFDIAVLDAVNRAAPFGPAPSAITSPDGKVYFHWEFHRDESACTTAHARPFLINVAPVSPEPQVPGEPPKPNEGPEQRHGAP